MGGYTDDFTIEMILKLNGVDGTNGGLVSHRWWGEGALHSSISADGRWSAGLHEGHTTSGTFGNYYYTLPLSNLVDTLTVSSSKGNYIKVFYNGQEEECSSLEYNLHQGANLISFCCSSPSNLNIIPESCTEIVGEGNASTFNPVLGWIGNLQELTPGKGYWLKCSDQIQIQWNCEE